MVESTTKPCSGPRTDEEADLFGPYTALYALQVLDRTFWVPEDNTVLRALQFVELEERAVKLPYKDYCWDDTDGCCLMRYRETPDAPEKNGRACVVRATPGLCVTKLPKGGKACW